MFRLPVLLISLLATSFALGDARQQLDQFADKLTSLSGEFVQLSFDESGRLVEESSGRLYFSEPDRFRWDYDEPFPQQLVADGEQLWHFDESLDQVTVRPQPDASESPLLVLLHPDMLERFYTVETGDRSELLEFVPLAEDAEFERARLFFRRGAPETLELHDRFGQLTQIVLSDLVRNPVLDEALFNFIPPEGVDVLEGY